MSDPHTATERLTQLLIIEQHHPSRESLHHALQGMSFCAHWTDNLSQARQLLQQHPIELIILDIVSGPSQQESGFEFALWLREQSPYAYVDLLFTSKDYPARLYREASLLRYQALEYLDKPIPQETWISLLQAFQLGDLLPPLTTQFQPPPHTSTESNHQADLFLLDPDEWANAVFDTEKKKTTTPTEAQEAPEYPDSAQDLPSFEEPTHAGRPTTEGRAILAQWQQQLSQRPSDEIFKIPTEERVREHAPSQLLGGSESSPHTDVPLPNTNPQYPITNREEAHQLAPAVAQAHPHAYQAEHPHPGQTRQHPPQLPLPRQSQPYQDPEREKPTQSLPGFQASALLLPRKDEAIQAPQTPQAPSNPQAQSAQAAFDEGIQALQQQQLDNALHAFYRAADLHPTPRHRAYFGWTLALSQGQDPHQLQRAEGMLQQAAQDDPSLEQTHYLLGRFYQQQRRFHEAIQTYQYALSINPQFQEVYREYRLLQLQMTR